VRTLPRAVGGDTTASAMDIQTLAALELSSADGARHRLGDLWRTRPVVLVFLRHFG
jgi:hypothetical protein